jgi:valyl-tRNA synthetase
MSMSLSKNFEPSAVEDKWYKHWLRREYFNSNPDERKPFTIVIPPPNVTGVLHMGHTLNETVQDVLIRKARMSGFNTCWVPGSDHASIATEAKVVQLLEKERGIKKEQISRDEFLNLAFEWKEKYGGIIYEQIKRLGCSVDWNRTTFTMDDHYYKAVVKVFVDLYNKGLIYRGARMINWDPNAKTALSDEEVEYKDVQGKLYYIKYKVVDSGQRTDDRIVDHQPLTINPNNAQNSPLGDGGIIIATQRPETIMGDTAVCVHPDDERYKHLKGKKIIVPLVNREVPVIFDQYVDPSFGTGVLKVTPAHDINDYNLGLKHNLPIIDTFNEDGTLSDAAEVFVGLDRFKAREKAIEQLRSDGLLIKEEDYATRLGFSQRTNAVVEPRISTQWFVKMKELAKNALDEVVSGNIKIYPEERFLATYKYWLENVKDWCISRQLWWGQRIPAWYDEEGNVYVAETQQEAIELYYKRNGQKPPPSGEVWRGPQDEDVLDTWFSSWLWPIEVFHGITQPDNEDINYYYPTSVLVTGQDIIFFWVARMIMAGMEYKNEKPFEHVYFTGMVRDKQGRKMSKSLGNSPDLLELIDKYGADAVRFGILISAPAGNDLLFDESSCEQGRNFNNKIWNALKLVKMWEGRQTSNVKSETTSDVSPDGFDLSRFTSDHSFAVEWFENRLNVVRKKVDVLYEEFKLSEALKTIYSLIWDDFCSWYLEWMKPSYGENIQAQDYQKTIYFFEQLMQLLHPFMPFVTEEIYHHLKEREAGDDLCIKQFELLSNTSEQLIAEGEFLKQIITAVRDARNKNGIKPKEKIDLHLLNSDSFVYGHFAPILLKQINACSLNSVSQPVPGTINVVIGKHKFFIESENAGSESTQKEQLLKDLEYLEGFLRSVQKKLHNENFLKSAKPQVIEIERKKESDAEQKIKAIKESLATLSEP